MNHPYDLLADLVDGTLDAGARAQVDAHLSTCASCREDVRAATTGRRVAGSLPEIPAPADLHRRVVERAGGRGGAVAPRWYRWAGAAAAAALVVAIALVLPELGGESDRPAAPEDAAAGIAESDVPSETSVPLEVQKVDYDAAGLERLAAEAAGTDAPAAAQMTDATTREAPEAIRCVARAFDQQPAGRLARLIQARFEGRSAYIAVYLEGRGADQPPDAAVAWVAARDDCEILSFAQARL